MREFLNISYGPDERNTFDIYLPDGEANVRHAVIWFYGGGLENGNKENYRFLAEPLTKRGIAVCLPNYRLMPGCTYPAFIEDAAQSVSGFFESMKAHGIHAPVTVGGSSAGAYLSMMLAFDRKYLSKHGLSPEDMHSFFFNSGQPTTHFNVLKYAGEDGRRIIVDERGALFHVNEDVCKRRYLLLLAENDMYSRVTQNVLLKETLIRFGVDESMVQMDVLPGFTHCGYDSKTDEDGENYLVKYIMRLIEA